MALYVYGVVPADIALPAGLRGIGTSAPVVHTLVAGRIAVVVSVAPERLRASRRDLQAHQDVQLALCEAGPLLPTRFGVVATDPEKLREQLSAADRDYRAALDRVTGRVEMNVKVSPVESGLSSLVRDDPQVRQARERAQRSPGMEADLQLGQAVVAGLRRRAEVAGRAVLGALRERAFAVQEGPELSEYVLNVSFLVSAREAVRFRSDAEGIARSHAQQAVVTLTGPLPCYSFSALPEPARS